MHKGSFLEVEPGVELYYEVNGEGAPLVFIPGWTFSTAVFDRQIEHFSKKHQTVSFDPRGQGRSTVSVLGNDYSTQSDDLCQLIDHLKLENPVLIGWSYGCLPLWGFVRRRGTEPLKGLVFIDMQPITVTDEGDGWTWSMAAATEFNQALTTPEGHRAFLVPFVREGFIERDLSDEEFDWMARQSTTSHTGWPLLMLLLGRFRITWWRHNKLIGHYRHCSSRLKPKLRRQRRI